MPKKPSNPCNFPLCPGLAVVGGYCRAHSHLASTQRKPDRRESASRRGYGADWRKIRAKIIKNHPYCLFCGAPAVHVDHIKPLRYGGTNDASNLQPLCAACHSRKTASEDGGFGNRRRGGAVKTSQPDRQNRVVQVYSSNVSSEVKGYA